MNCRQAYRERLAKLIKERLIRAAIEEYEAKGYTVTRIGDEITVTGGPKDVEPPE